jgi:hypothetical protein
MEHFPFACVEALAMMGRLLCNRRDGRLDDNKSFLDDFNKIFVPILTSKKSNHISFINFFLKELPFPLINVSMICDLLATKNSVMEMLYHLVSLTKTFEVLHFNSFMKVIEYAIIKIHPSLKKLFKKAMEDRDFIYQIEVFSGVLDPEFLTDNWNAL